MSTAGSSPDARHVAAEGRCQAPLHWPAEAIWEAVVAWRPGFTVEILPSVDSTNSELMRRAHAGRAEPVLLVAEQQTAGRGRLGRQWLSGTGADLGATLTFSLGLPLQAADWSGLSLLVGLSLAQSLHPDLRLKWPNDLWLGERKLGGILIETTNAGAQRYAVIGVGLNIASRPASGLSTPPAWLQELHPELDAPTVLLRVAAPLVQTVLAFERQGFAPWQPAFARRDALAGREITLSNGSHGQAAGIDERGALLVHTATGLQRIDSAEVSVRPRHQ